MVAFELETDSVVMVAIVLIVLLSRPSRDLCSLEFVRDFARRAAARRKTEDRDRVREHVVTVSREDRLLLTHRHIRFKTSLCTQLLICEL